MIKKEINEEDVKSIDNSLDIEDDDDNDEVSNEQLVIYDKIKIESENETIPQLLSNSKSPEKLTSEESRQSPNIVNIVHLEDTLSPPTMQSPSDSKYCSNCDISFTYSNTFIAHKKFYCPSGTLEKLMAEKATNNGASPNGSNVNVSIAAETSV